MVFAFIQVEGWKFLPSDHDLESMPSLLKDTGFDYISFSDPIFQLVLLRKRTNVYVFDGLELTREIVSSLVIQGNS